LNKKNGFINILFSIFKAIGFLALFLGAQLIVMVVFSAVLEILQKPSADIANYTPLMLIISAILSFGIIFALHGISKKKLNSELNIKKIPLNQFITAFIFGVIFNRFTIALMSILPIPQAWYDANEKSVDSVTSGNYIIAIISTIIIAPIIEEIIFRGGVYFTLRKTIGPIFAAIISAAAFGIFHGNILQMLYTAFCAFFMIYVFEKTNSLIGSIMVHVGFNSSAIFFALLSSRVNISENVMLIITGILCLFCLIYISTFISRRKKKDRPF